MDMFKFHVHLFICLNIFICNVNASDIVTVMRLSLPYEIQHALSLNNSIEYIIDFLPNPEQALWPTSIWLQTAGADTVRPVLITARQITGAVTWQLPAMTSSGRIMNEMERTLCPAANVNEGEESHCVGTDEKLREVTVHIGSTCVQTVVVSIRVSPVRDWNLGFQSESTVQATETAPRSFLYLFLPEQENVRLILNSNDDICATISIQNYTCPLLEDESEVQQTGQRMTMMRSGGVQLSRSNYPAGFYLVVIVRSTDEVCTGEVVVTDEDWLFSQILWGETEKQISTIIRTKTLSIRIEPALTRAQYAIASVVTVVIFLVFYLLFMGFVLMQKFERFKRIVGPVKQPEDDTRNEEGTQTDAAEVVTTLRRHDSNTTLDRSDGSDSDESENETQIAHVRAANNVAFADSVQIQSASSEEPHVNNTEPTEGAQPSATAADGNEGGEEQTPYGLPPQLRLAALSKHRAKVLRVRSDRYLWTLVTVAVFYALPVVQFVASFQFVLNVSGSLDICYYNFLCAHPAGQVSDFNHVFSNLGYLMLGALFIIQVYRRRRRRKGNPRNEEYGIPSHYGLLNSLGAGMMVVALLSASYHICPNRLNFQFDTAFMYVLAVIMMVKIYQSRHPDVNARAHATFGVLAVIIALGVWGVLGGGPFFWGIFTVLHLFTFLLLSLRIYYLGQFRLEKETFQRAARGLAALPKHGVQPLYRTRLVMLLVVNCVNWGFAIFGMWTQSSDFAGHLLSVLLGNTLLYMGFYLTMKLLHGERPRWYVWCFLAGAIGAWIPALYFFKSGSSSWSSTPAMSRHRNHECRILEFYDNHDLWHFLSAIALYLTFNTLLTWDDGLMAVKRTEIAVF